MPDSLLQPQSDSHASALTNRAKLERISEPWALNKTFAIAFTLTLAMLFGSWIGSGQIENLVLVMVWLLAAIIIVFVQDYWWSPPLIVSTLGIGTTALGFPMGGLEIGIVILAITFPMKVAMKTLRKAEPELDAGLAYWTLLAFFVSHCVVILFYNHIGGAPLKNIVRSYFQTGAPLILCGLLFRYCHTRTIKPTVMAIFFANLFVVPVSALVVLKGMSIDPFGDLRISFGWLDADLALGMLRNSGPVLFIGSLAFWPAVRRDSARLLLAVAAVLGLLGTMVGGGRLPFFCCIIAGVFFAVIRGKVWIAIPFALCAATVSAIITASPDLFFSLPSLIQRSIAPLNFNSVAADEGQDFEGSNEWHAELRNRSLIYWFMDTNSFWLGHGFKSWDQSIPRDDPGGVEHEHMVELAVEMGATENMFSSITNIFGMTGLLLYGWFLARLCRLLFKGYRLSPPGSDARALCEFSLINILSAIILCPFMGYVPGLNLIIWQLGVLAARPYLGVTEEARAGVKIEPEIPAFARPAFAKGLAGAPSRTRPARV